MYLDLDNDTNILNVKFFCLMILIRNKQHVSNKSSIHENSKQH